MMVWEPDRGLDFEALRLAIEGCDPDLVLGFYADNAQLSIVNIVTPHVSSFVLRGKAEIAKHLRATFGQEASHRVERDAVVERGSGDIPGGVRVPGRRPCAGRDEAGGARGKILRQVDVVAKNPQAERHAEVGQRPPTRNTHPETHQGWRPPARPPSTLQAGNRKGGKHVVKRTGVILSVGMLALVLLALALLGATGSTGEFVAWAWGRHHNVLSWYIRPLFFLPFCYFAYKRSLSGMILTLLALATSISGSPHQSVSNPTDARVFWPWRESTLLEIGRMNEGPSGLNRADQFRGVGPGLLEALYCLRAGAASTRSAGEGSCGVSTSGTPRGG